MAQVKMTVRMLAAMMKISIEEMARRAGIDPSHLKQVSAGNVRMTAEDLIRLSKLTGVDPEDIDYAS